MMLVEHFDILALMLWMLMLGNLFMLIFGVWGSKYFPKILSIPQQILMPIILVLCVTGSYAVANSFFDVQIALILGILGFIMVKYEFPLAPLVLGLILGPIMEPNFRRALVANQMNPMIFITSPISLFFLLLTLFTAVMVYRRTQKSPAK